MNHTLQQVSAPVSIYAIDELDFALRPPMFPPLFR